MKTVFDFKDYRAFLQEALPVEGPNRGARNRLAEALNCQKGFVSQVLGGRSHFSLEHGMRICRFLKLDPQEEEFFVLLLHHGRAGSKELESFYERKLADILERRKEIKERIRSNSELSEAEQMTYYSSWHYTAVHMCLFLKRARTRTAIAEFLGVSPQIVARVLEFLLSVGIARQEGDEFISGPTRFHVSKDSPFVSRHHTNWRMRAIHSLDEPGKQDLHYSLIMSVSDEAAGQIREILLKGIQDVEPVLQAAEDKTVYALNIDLFALEK